MNDAYIALGTNIGPRESYINSAIQALAQHVDITIEKKSSIYETVPVGYLDQEDFLNMVIKVGTTLSAEELLFACQKIEQQLGRKRIIRNGPRTIDLDILLFNQIQKHTEHLIIPHPRMHERAFVLVPLNEIAAHTVVPSCNETVNGLLEQMPQIEKDNVLHWQTDI